MITFEDEIRILKQEGLIKGVRPTYVEIIKSYTHPYKGKYLITIDKDRLLFYELKPNYKFKEKNQINFFISLDSLIGYHYAYFKQYYKKISLHLKDDKIIEFSFVFGFDKVYGNDKNAEYLMKYLKDNKILQKNEIKVDNNGQKVISKNDQYFTQEVRNTNKRKGLFR